MPGILYRPFSFAKNSTFSSRIANRAGSADNAAKAGKRADSDYFFPGNTGILYSFQARQLKLLGKCSCVFTFLFFLFMLLD